MSGDLEKVLGPLEAQVVEALWDFAGPATVRQVLERLNDRRQPKLAYTTVMTVMSRLAEKGVLTREPKGRGYAYEPAVRDAAELAVRDVVREFGQAAVVHFIEEARGDRNLLQRLERLMRADE